MWYICFYDVSIPIQQKQQKTMLLFLSLQISLSIPKLSQRIDILRVITTPLVGAVRHTAAPTLEEKRRVEYFRLDARSLLNRCSSPHMPFAWTINPYRGCEFGCKYCYARSTHEFMELRAPNDFEERIYAKEFPAEAFRAELKRVGPEESIAIGTATDPYQPAERRYGLTRAILEVFGPLRGYRLSITTKSDLIARDADLLAEIAAGNS